MSKSPPVKSPPAKPATRSGFFPPAARAQSADSILPPSPARAQEAQEADLNAQAGEQEQQGAHEPALSQPALPPAAALPARARQDSPKKADPATPGEHVSVDARLKQVAKLYAVQHKTTLRTVVEQALLAYLTQQGCEPELTRAGITVNK